MAILRGRRVAPVKNNQSNLNVLDISRGEKSAAKALPDGEHELTIHSATHKVNQRGSVVVILDAVDAGGQPVRIRPLLVQSPGGDSDLTIGNLETLEQLAKVSEGAKLRTILEGLTQRKVLVDLTVALDRASMEVNDIVSVLISGAVED